MRVRTFVRKLASAAASVTLRFLVDRAHVFVVAEVVINVPNVHSIGVPHPLTGTNQIHHLFFHELELLKSVSVLKNLILKLVGHRPEQNADLHSVMLS